MTERPNVRRMQMPERNETKLAFDAEKELSKRFWSEVRNSFDNALDANDWRHALATGAYLVTLGRRNNVHISPANWGRIEHYVLDVSAKSLSLIKNIKELENIKIIRPNYDFNIAPYRWITVSNSQQKRRDEGSWTDLSEYAKSYKIVRGEDTLSGTDVEKLLEMLVEYRNDGAWHKFTTLADKLCTTKPEVDFSISESDWTGMREILSTYISEAHWRNTIVQAAEMQNLAKWEARNKPAESPRRIAPQPLDI